MSGMLAGGRLCVGTACSELQTTIESTAALSAPSCSGMNAQSPEINAIENCTRDRCKEQDFITTQVG